MKPYPKDQKYKVMKKIMEPSSQADTPVGSQVTESPRNPVRIIYRDRGLDESTEVARELMEMVVTRYKAEGPLKPVHLVSEKVMFILLVSLLPGFGSEAVLSVETSVLT